MKTIHEIRQHLIVEHTVMVWKGKACVFSFFSVRHRLRTAILRRAACENPRAKEYFNEIDLVDESNAMLLGTTHSS